MTMPRDLILPGAIAGLALVAVAVGLTVAGGPGRGKVEQRDALRIGQIETARNHVVCLARANGDTLPETLAETLAETLTDQTSCDPGDSLQDPFTEAPVGYEKLNARSFQLCPALELGADNANRAWVGGGQFDAGSSCIRYDYRP